MKQKIFNSCCKRIILKISGEVLQGKKQFGINANTLNRITKEIKQLVTLDYEIGIIVGGGNLFRGKDLIKIGIKPVISDYIGMLSTIINGLAIKDALHRIYINARLMSVIPLNGICDHYDLDKAIRLLKKQKVIILSAGIGNPFFTTDLAACVRGIEIEANIILKATKVDGVYSEDPIKNPNAILHEKLTYQEVLDKNLKIMDLAALILAKEYELPIQVFNINKPGSLLRVITGKKEGTIITK